MDRRSHESPMDFEWSNKTGPINSHSPFVTAGQQFQEKGTKRSFGIFGSPSKSNAPSLRDPSVNPNQTFLFSSDALPRAGSPDKPLPPTPSWLNNPRFNTPRKVETDFISSNENTPNSPDKGDDAESDATPDIMSLRSRTGNLFARFTGQKDSMSSVSKSERNKTALVASPGRGEVPRGYSTKGQKRVEKRRSKGGAWTRRKGSTVETEDSGVESDTRIVPTRKTSSKHQNTSAGGDSQKQQSPISEGQNKWEKIFAFLEAHPSLPHVLSFYAQFLLNVFLMFFFVYIVYSFWSTVRNDVDRESNTVTAEILAEIAVCAQHYRDNRCERETRAPALQGACEAWEKCMRMDAEKVGRARVSARTFAEILNSFIEPISYKTMFFTFLLVFGSIVASNFAFGFFRNKTNAHFHAPPPYSYPPPPPTPQRYPSNGHNPGFLEHDPNGYWTPHGNRHMSLDPGPSGSPVKSLTFH